MACHGGRPGCKEAINLGSHEPFGLRLLQQEEPADAAQRSPLLSAVFSIVHGDDDIDEDISVVGNRVVWSAAGIVRRRFTLESPATSVLQVAWATFAGMDGDRALCMLQHATLTTYSLKGELHTVSLPPHISSMHPLPHGLILSGLAGACSVLTHPLEPLVGLHTEEGVSERGPMAGERILWSSREVPYIATHNQQSGRTAVWAVRDGIAPRRTQPAGNPGATPRTPAHLLRNAAGNPPSASKRQSLRTPDGHLSPAAFSPVSRAAEAAAANLQAAGLLSVQLHGWPRPVAYRLWEQKTSTGEEPSSGALATGPDGAPLLVLHSKAAQKAVAVQLLGQNAQEQSAKVAFTLSAAAVVAVKATCADKESGLPARDLLVLHPRGGLALYAGARHVCDVSVRAPAAPQAGAVQSLIRSLLPCLPAGGHSRRLSRTGSGMDMSDASMGASDGGGTPMAQSPRSDDVTAASGPNVAALGEALEAPLEFTELKDAVGNRATLGLKDGRSWRIALPFRPTHLLPRLALDALSQALEPPVWHTLFSSHLICPGSTCGDGEQEWEAFSAFLLRWAADPDSLMSQCTQVGGLASCTTTRDTEAGAQVTPGGSVNSGAAFAWEALVHSDNHRELLQRRRYPFLKRRFAHAPSQPAASAAVAKALPAVGTTGHANAWLALHALHAIYEDCKLHLLRWKFLPKLAALLYALAGILTAPEYQDRYVREMGHEIARAAAQMGAAGKQTTIEGHPADVMRAMHLYLSGKPEQARTWVPQFASSGAACLCRTADMLAFYECIASSSEDCARELCAGMDASSGKAAPNPDALARLVLVTCERLVTLMVEKGWTQQELDSLPIGVALPLREALHKCRGAPPSGWSAAAYALVGRADLAEMAAAAAEAEAASKQAPAQAVRAAPSMAMEAGVLEAARLGNLGDGGGRRPQLSPLWQPKLRTPAAGHHTQRSRLSIGGSRHAGVGATEAAARMEAATLAGLAHNAAGPPGRFAVPAPAHRPAQQLGLVSPLEDVAVAHSDIPPALPYTQRLRREGLAAEARLPQEKPSEIKSVEKGNLPDGMESLFNSSIGLRFARDKRMLEVRKLMASSAPVPLHVPAAPEAADTEQLQAQQQALLTLGCRVMALPIGRGPLTLGTMQPLPTEPVTFPALCLAGRLPEQQNATVNLDLTHAQHAPGGGASADVTAWPEFHNGVATGLRIAKGAAPITRTWILYNKPRVPQYTHAGVLMGLGLADQLSCLTATDVYRYMSQEHDATTMGLLLGMAAAKAGTMDPVVSKMLFMHAPSLGPQAYAELELSSLVQSAALLGLGLLFRGSCHRLTAELMMEEIGRRPTTTDSAGAQNGSVSHPDNREGYAWAAAMGLGLITLGRGRSAAGLADMRIEQRLRHFMVGNSNASSSVKQSAKSDAAPSRMDPLAFMDVPDVPLMAAGDRRPPQLGTSQVILEGNLINLDVTAPGATLALGLMYLKTGDAAVARAFAIPGTHFALDYVKPELILLRVLAQGLVMWDEVAATKDWVESQLPDILKGDVKQHMGKAAEEASAKAGAREVDHEALAQAHVNAITGACMAIGIKHAGTGSAAAQALLSDYILYLLDAKNAAMDSLSGGPVAWGQLDKAAAETCICAVTLSLAAVMAGSGHLQTMRLIRSLAKRLQPVSSAQTRAGAALNHGSHMAMSMALGLLFMGGGATTFSTDDEAVAALVIALYPKFPRSTTDNRHHHQAYRHLYVLATEQRCVHTVDVHTQMPVVVPLAITLKQGASSQLQQPVAETPASERSMWSAAETPAQPQPGGEGLVISRTAPCLLPELQHVAEVQVKGPRYWQQRVVARPEGDGPLGALYGRGALPVQLQRWALSYTQDPSGVRGLLSQAFDEGAGMDKEGFDLVHLCSTFASDPFVMAFAKLIESGQAQGGERGAEAEHRALSRAALRECICEDKLSCLVGHLWLHSSAAALADTTGADFKRLCGGVPPAVPMWSLRLARSFHESCLGQACSSLAALHSGPGHSGRDWRPLMRVSFLEVQRHKWERALAAGGVLPASGQAASQGPLSSYLQAGSTAARPAAPTDQEAAWKQELFGAFLSLSMMPAPGEASQALAQAANVAAGTAKQAASTVSRRQKAAAAGAASQQALHVHSITKIALARALPNTPPEALEYISHAAGLGQHVT